MNSANSERDEQDEEDPQRPGAAPVAAEIVEPALVHRREPGPALDLGAFLRLLGAGRLSVVKAGLDPAIHGLEGFEVRHTGPSPAMTNSRIDQAQTSRVSKSMRGSIQV